MNITKSQRVSLQLDPGNTGKISAGDAAQFLKTSGLPDSTLGKVSSK